MGQGTTETKIARLNTVAPMGHSSLRETDDLADELYDIPVSFDLGDGKAAIRAGWVLLIFCWVGLGVGLGLYLGKHFTAP